MAPRRHSSTTLVTVRRGAEILYVQDPSLADKLLFRDYLPPQRVQDTPLPQNDFIDSITHGAATVLDKLVASFKLGGPAATCLSTALRVRAVRASLGQQSDLLRHLRFIAQGADAFRHLSPALVSNSISDLEGQLVSPLASSPSSCTDAEAGEEGRARFSRVPRPIQVKNTFVHYDDQGWSSDTTISAPAMLQRISSDHDLSEVEAAVGDFSSAELSEVLPYFALPSVGPAIPVFQAGKTATDDGKKDASCILQHFEAILAKSLDKRFDGDLEGSGSIAKIDALCDQINSLAGRINSMQTNSSSSHSHPSVQRGNLDSISEGSVEAD